MFVVGTYINPKPTGCVATTFILTGLVSISVCVILNVPVHPPQLSAATKLLMIGYGIANTFTENSKAMAIKSLK